MKWLVGVGIVVLGVIVFVVGVYTWARSRGHVLRTRSARLGPERGDRRAARQTFRHNDYDPLLVGMILERATGMPVASYRESRLWQPMGAEAEGSWSFDSESSGFEKMESGINGRAVDLMKLGLAFADEGRSGDVQIVPAEWVAWATSVDTTDDPAEEYQAFWWTLPDSDAFSAVGNHGQIIYADPVRDVAVALFGRSYGELDHIGWPALFDDLVATLPAAG